MENIKSTLASIDRIGSGIELDACTKGIVLVVATIVGGMVLALVATILEVAALVATGTDLFAIESPYAGVVVAAVNLAVIAATYRWMCSLFAR